MMLLPPTISVSLADDQLVDLFPDARAALLEPLRERAVAALQGRPRVVHRFVDLAQCVMA